MKGIILAGGYGTRLYPATLVVSKQLLPIYDKPMIYYPLSVLMLGGIREILIISTPKDIERFKELFSDGSWLGISIEYAVQEKPLGLAQAFTIGEGFIGEESVSLVLGDNIFYGHGLPEILKSGIKSIEKDGGSIIFAYSVKDPQRYGVVEFDDKGNVISVEEKPKNPKSNYAIVGLYIFDNDVVRVSKNLKPSLRGEYEIVDLIRWYLERKRVSAKILGRGFAWLDAGTHDSYIDAGDFVRILEKRQGVKIGCIEEVAFRNGWISGDDLLKISEKYKNNDYGKYLKDLLK